MLFTLKDARNALGRFIESGTCRTSVIDERINEALFRVMDMDDWDCLRKQVRVTVNDRCFCLPYCVEKILWADIDGTAVRVYAEPYQFLSSGPGDLDTRTGILQDILDKGDGWPTMYDIPTKYELDDVEYTPSGMPLFARCVSRSDVGKVLKVWGTNTLGEEIYEEIALVQWADGVEGNIVGKFDTISAGIGALSFVDINRVIKPETSGYVSLYATDLDTKFMSFLAKYSPRETVPSFRRYAITNKCCQNDSAVLALVRMRYVPLADEDDIVPIDNLQALKMMIIAIREENAGNIQGAVQYEMQAKRLMEERQRAGHMTSGTPFVIDIDYSSSLGKVMTHGLIL